MLQGLVDGRDWLAEVAGQAVADDPSFGWAIVAWNAAAGVEGAWFDGQLAEAVVRLWPTWATLTVDRFSTRPFRLTVWEEIIVRLLVGWRVPIELVDPDTHETTTAHVRLFRKLLLWVQRKNGKSEFLAALALLFFVLDGVTEGEGYVFARKDEQAQIVYGRMRAMIANSPRLKGEVLPQAKSLYVKALRANFYRLTGSTAGLHGKSPNVIVGDEMHEWTSTAIADTLRQGSGGRLEPIELYASTAGRKSGGHSAGEQLYEQSLAIIQRRRVEPTTLAVIFAAAETDDPGDEAVWRKANPNLGLAPNLHFMRQEYAAAIGNPRKLADFKCYHLGIWAEPNVRWLPLAKWDACASGPEAWRGFPDELRGAPCYAGLDVSSTTDITALVLLFPPHGERLVWRVICRFWIPEDRVEARRAEGAPVDDLIAAGALETTPGDYVDQNFVGVALQEADRDYELLLAGVDPWNARKLMADLKTPGGIVDSDAPPIDEDRIVEIRQGIPSLGEASKHFERLVFEGVLDHGGHPTLRWMAGNVVVHFDRNLNFFPAKNKSADKIDGIMSAVMAVACADYGETPAVSPWEDPDFKLARGVNAASAGNRPGGADAERPAGA